MQDSRQNNYEKLHHAKVAPPFLSCSINNDSFVLKYNFYCCRPIPSHTELFLSSFYRKSPMKRNRQKAASQSLKFYLNNIWFRPRSHFIRFSLWKFSFLRFKIQLKHFFFKPAFLLFKLFYTKITFSVEFKILRRRSCPLSNAPVPKQASGDLENSTFKKPSPSFKK